MRELISKVQTMRKEAGFEVTDHITLYVSDNENIAGIVRKNAQQIQTETLSDSIVYDQKDGYEKSWNLNGETATLCVKH